MDQSERLTLFCMCTQDSKSKISAFREKLMLISIQVKKNVKKIR